MEHPVSYAYFITYGFNFRMHAKGIWVFVCVPIHGYPYNTFPIWSRANVRINPSKNETPTAFLL